MTWSRRELLQTLGVASAQAILLACGGPQRASRRVAEGSNEIRGWLREAVAVLRGAGFDEVHVLAVRRHRMTAALDVLGGGVARSSADGVVLSVKDHAGVRREHVTNDLSSDGVAAAVRVLTGGAKVKPAAIDFGFMPPLPKVPPPDPDALSDDQLLARVAAMANRDRSISSRIVYSAGLIDLEDAHVYSVAPGRDLEQRLVRVRKSITRVAWNGTRPIVAEAARAWSGGVDDQDLDDDELTRAREDALTLLTPRAFTDGEHGCVLEPEVAASILDVAVGALMTADAVRRPEVASRLSASGNAVSPAITLVDDPMAAHAYGGFEFDDAGVLARPVTLIDSGKLVGRIGEGRSRRAGHVGTIEHAASHLRITAGTDAQDQLLADGFVLEGALGAVVDPASDRLVVSVARARERASGRRTGRVFADVELVGSLAGMLSAITAVSKETRTIGLRDEIDGQPRWRSIETPWLRTKALLRARRGQP